MIALLLGMALAAQPVVVSVSLDAAEGELPADRLSKLLSLETGEPLNMAAVRRDIATLYRVGSFSSVEAHAEAALLFDENGKPLDALDVTYVVKEAPRLDAIRVTGRKKFPRQALFRAVELTDGQVFYPSIDLPLIERRLHAALLDNGFPDADFELDVSFAGRDYELWVRLSEGEPQRVNAVTITAPAPVPKAAIRKVARQAGVKPKSPLPNDALEQAIRSIEQDLADMRRLPFRRYRGWLDAEVTAAPFPDGNGLKVHFAVNPRTRVDLRVKGIGAQGRRRFLNLTGLTRGTRITPGWQRASEHRVAEFLQSRGYADGTATITDNRSGDTRTLTIVGERGPRYHLGDFTVAGNEHAKRRELIQAFKQTGDASAEGFYREAELDGGLLAIERFYAGRGYIDANAEIIEQTDTMRKSSVKKADKKPHDINLTVRVDEGPRVELQALTVQWITKRDGAEDVLVTEVKSLEKALVGHPVDLRALERASRDLANALKAQGFLDARVTARFGRIDDTHAVAEFDVESGVQVLLRSVSVRGLRVTRRRFIDKLLRLHLAEPLTPEVVSRAQKRLSTLGIFRSVDSNILGDERSRDLVIAVEESPLYLLDAGFGINSDQGIRGYLRGTRRNLWGLAHQLELFGALGLDFGAGGSWFPTNPEWRFSATYTARRFPLTRQALTIDLLFRDRQQEITWRMDRTGGGIGLETRWDRASLRFRARVEQRRLDDFQRGAVVDGEAWSYYVDTADPYLPTRWRPAELVDALLYLDFRDDPFQTHKGATAQVQFTYGPGLFQQQAINAHIPWVKLEGRVRGWIPLGRRPRIRLEVYGGWADAYKGGNLPLEDRFRLGGTGSMRGFKRDAVGPQNRVPRIDPDWGSVMGPVIEDSQRNNPTAWVPTGGDATAFASVEFQLPFPVFGLDGWEGWSFAIFGDMGNVWFWRPGVTVSSEEDVWRSIFNPLFRYSAGLGLRVETPIGPLRADAAVNLQAAAAQGAVRDLLWNQWNEPIFRVHLTLGAF